MTYIFHKLRDIAAARLRNIGHVVGVYATHKDISSMWICQHLLL